tara:strand:- start:2749 stop:3765 length:1017 start_codon:yes stop_codon:yes gene_type:complete
MIKIKLTNWNKGRNEPTFRPLLIHQNIFSDIGIQFVDKGSYDFEFVGMADFINKKISLKDSINYGLEYINNLEGDYFLFDGSDSTSIMGAYEVFQQSNAKYLFKSAKTTIEQYKKPSAFNKWFFGKGSDLDLSYGIKPEIYDKIKLNGWNFGYYNPSYLNFDYSNKERNIDICAIYMGFHPKNYCHEVRDDIAYTKHRTRAWDILKSSKDISYEIDKRPPPEFADVMTRSKCTLSPYGQGELCFRDFEIIKYGSVMIKPDMSKVITYPNIYIPFETYIPCKLDYSDLIEKIQWVKDNPKKCQEISNNARKLYKEMYTKENLVIYWHKLLSNLNEVTYE